MSLQVTAQDNKLENQKQPKSIRLSPLERSWFKKYAKRFTSDKAAAIDLGVHRTTMSNTLKMGTCGPSTYEKIREKIESDPIETVREMRTKVIGGLPGQASASLSGSPAPHGQRD